MKNVLKFFKDKLGNINILNENNLEPKEIIKHIELYTSSYNLNINLSREEFELYNSIYIYIRYSSLDKDKLTNVLKEVFTVKYIYFECEKIKEDINIIDMIFIK